MTADILDGPLLDDIFDWGGEVDGHLVDGFKQSNSGDKGNKGLGKLAWIQASDKQGSHWYSVPGGFTIRQGGTGYDLFWEDGKKELTGQLASCMRQADHIWYGEPAHSKDVPRPNTPRIGRVEETESLLVRTPEGYNKNCPTCGNKSLSRNDKNIWCTASPCEYSKNFINPGDLKEQGAWLAHHGLMPGYGQIYSRSFTGEVWYVGGDGDDDGFGKLVQEKLGGIPGVSEVFYEAEVQPKDEGWMLIYDPQSPRLKGLDYRTKDGGAPKDNNWRTIEGAHVHFDKPQGEHGEIDKGPPELVGKKPNELPPRKQETSPKQPKVKPSKLKDTASYQGDAKTALKAAVPKLKGGAQALIGIHGKDFKTSVSSRKAGNSTIVKFESSNPDVSLMERELIRYGNGTTVMRNVMFIVNESAQGKGLGTDVFVNQVRECRQQGITRITCDAAKGAGKGMNGYYTWPRLGYDATLEDDFKNKLPEQFTGSESVLDLMSKPGGTEYWKEHGYQTEMAFDLSKDSRSVQVLNAYLKQKGLATI